MGNVYLSFDDGNSWKPFQLNLPITAIRDLHIKENDLVVATHGRAFWIIDDLTPLASAFKKFKFLKVLTYTNQIFHTECSLGGTDQESLLNGENHPNGVIINYFIKDLKDMMTLLKLKY